MSSSCDCCVLSERGLCDGLFPHPEESDRVVCVCVCVFVSLSVFKGNTSINHPHLEEWVGRSRIRKK